MKKRGLFLLSLLLTCCSKPSNLKNNNLILGGISETPKEYLDGSKDTINDNNDVNTTEKNESNNQQNDDYVSSGFNIKTLDLQCSVVTAVRCLKQQNSTISFEVAIGHNKSFSDLLSSTYLEDNGASGFGLERKILNTKTNISTSTICKTLEDFESDDYNFTITRNEGNYVFNYSYLTNISLDISDFESSVGMISFGLSLIDSNNEKVPNCSYFYGVEEFATLYFKINTNSIEFSKRLIQ